MAYTAIEKRHVYLKSIFKARVYLILISPLKPRFQTQFRKISAHMIHMRVS